MARRPRSSLVTMSEPFTTAEFSAVVLQGGLITEVTLSSGNDYGRFSARTNYPVASVRCIQPWIVRGGHNCDYKGSSQGMVARNSRCQCRLAPPHNPIQPTPQPPDDPRTGILHHAHPSCFLDCFRPDVCFYPKHLSLLTCGRL